MPMHSVVEHPERVLDKANQEKNYFRLSQNVTSKQRPRQESNNSIFVSSFALSIKEKMQATQVFTPIQFSSR